ncbi:abortive infection family protein [Pseudomonas glycinae]|uniref:abortive infection family protein n=1 Tax=Pseudomonas glycinae TaxID=1785145 RepID=UPI001F38B4FB|nr:abortive infection family protein [Pseudomonas glycinae]
MANRPPLTDAIVIAISRLIDDSQSEKREPTHSDIEFQIDQARLTSADPGRLGNKPIGKSKRVRGTLSWALSNNPTAGESLVAGLISTVQGYGGFRPASSNYCGSEAITNLTTVFAAQGWDLSLEGTLQPRVLGSLAGKALTSALQAYADRARRGSLDSPLLAGTAKDLLEATAAHVLVEKWGSYPSTSNFPTLLGQAFTALGLATPSDPIVAGDPVHRRMERAAYDLGCALNALRNKEGTGHGRPWISSLTPAQARFSIESMGNIASLMLEAMA